MNYSALIPNGRDQNYLNMTLVSVLTQQIKPKEIIIFNDSNTRHFDQAIFGMCDNLDIKVKILRDPSVKSMFAIRESLIKEASCDYCLFVDDDMVLNSDVAKILLDCFQNMDLSKALAFAQGLRIEVGGRTNNSPDDINQVRSNTPENTPIYYGDTAILMFNRQTFIDYVPWDSIRGIMDNRNMGGSDVVITMSIIDNGFSGVAAPKAVGYHFAEPNFSYWAGFSTADIYIQKNATFISKETLDKVYSRR